ncbi:MULTISPECIES: cardiolipin synthase [unclassified Polynucleobacter]|jgi:cardiolipin synthase|uniref:cardiolipin synthase n=1 Tax=unclassified Polynucleobacter TaxID=2640945 RepID=UPI000929F6A1|nr:MULTISPECIES: cardiolipin synthase [unclassified Polynucleobacter]MBU3563694.1 cardiolipin synthase [Polynucleobacter sp. Tro8-14-1]MEA9567053.1 cardiolipin synthase [Polynucleobacter sp. AP-Nickl1-40-C4]OJI04933.1 cardiolipin synthase [Polynucleobacter sp. MWH-Adler-W8]
MNDLLGIFINTQSPFNLRLILLIHFLLVTYFILLIISVRRPVGVAFAWIFIVMTFPLLGIGLYILIGERPVGRALTRKIIRMNREYQETTELMRKQFIGDREELPLEGKALSLLAESKNGSPVVAGNKIKLHTESLKILQNFIDEINSAKKSLHLEFYIWALGGDADRVCEALITAAKRGVACRVLLDSLGSKDWFKSAWPKRFKTAGIQVTEALPIQIGRFQFRRADLRLHRKIFVVDGSVVWTGSMNMVDPRTFKQDSGVGEWVDAMVRIEGPVASQFELTFSLDWSIDNPKITHFNDREPPVSPHEGGVLAQEFSSGPVYRDDILYQVLLSAIMDARQELTITTPYFGPDDGLLQALMAAAARGVNVTLIVPKLNDSKLVAWSSRSFYGDLMNAGVKIAEFHGGLLHTKSLLIDKRIAIFGSVNFDQRSLRLNFEISLIVYDDDFCANLERLIQSYLAQSDYVDPKAWAKRPRWHRYLENAAHLTSPLL